MQIISLERALELGFDTVHVFQFAGFGDAVQFGVVAREKVSQTGAPLLMATKPKNYDMLRGIDDGLPAEIFILDGYYSQIVNKKNIRRLGKMGLHVNYFCQSGRHIIAYEIAAGMGMTGTVDLTPYLHIDKKLDDFGRLVDGPQIAIMAGGHPYKSIPNHVLQEIIDHFKHKYNFVQIGLADDPLLSGVIDMRGKLSFFQQVPALLRASDLFIGNEGGLMHMAAAVRTRAVIGDALYGVLTADVAHIHVSPKKRKPFKCKFPGDMETIQAEDFFEPIEQQMKLALSGAPVPRNIVSIDGVPAHRRRIRRDSLIVNLIDLAWRSVNGLLRGRGLPHDRFEQLKYKLRYGIPL